MAFKASPSSQHQHCTDEAQKAETVLSAVMYLTLFKHFFVRVSSVALAAINCGSASLLSSRAVLPLVVL